MATLAEFILGRLQAAGFSRRDVSRVEWDTQVEYVDGPSWVTVDRESFIAAAQQVEVREIDPLVRPRLRFWIVTSSAQEVCVAWNGSDFAVAPQRPRIVQVNPAMLRGE